MSSSGDDRHLIKLRYVWGIWLLFGLFVAAQHYLVSRLVGFSISVPAALLRGLGGSQVYFLGTLPALLLAERFPIERGNWPLRTLLHLCASLLFSATVLSVTTTLGLWQLLPQGLRGVTVLHILQGVLGNLDEGVYVYWGIVFITHAYRYYSRYRDEELRTSQLETQLARAQFQTLKSQLQPHFLFNTLNSISLLVHEDPRAAEKMLAHLCDFLRTTLNESGLREVTLRHELDVLNSYLQIQSVRFHDRLSVMIIVDPAAEGALVPNLLLQPLAENAIKHGIAPYDTVGRIEIRARREDARLRIQVFNDGPGTAGAARPAREGIGISNTRARLRHLYGAAHSIEFKTLPGSGFLVDLTIPFREGAGGQGDGEVQRPGG